MDQNFEQLIEEGTSFLLEFGNFQSPYLTNFIGRKIANVSWTIMPHSIEILVDEVHRKVLVYFEMNVWGRWFSRSRVLTNTQSMLESILPHYEFRVIDDPIHLKKAKDILKNPPRLNPTE